MSLATSMAIVLLICLTSYLLRLIARRFILSAFPRSLVLEAIAVSELAGCCFELAVVLENYGLSMWALTMFVLSCYWSVGWMGAHGSPCQHVEDWWQDHIDLTSMFSNILAEVVGGWITWRYMRPLWSLEISPHHSGLWRDVCSADLQVTPVAGALAEGAAVLLSRIAARTLDDMGIPFATVLNSVANVLLVIAGFEYSGGYYNPALASAVKFGCHGHTALEHMTVYWVGTTVGAISSVYAYPMVKSLLQNRVVKQD